MNLNLYGDLSIIVLFNQHHRGTIWYFDPGSNFCLCILSFELHHGKLNTPFLPKQGVQNTIRGCSIYHAQRGQNTMGREYYMHVQGVHSTIDMEFNIPWEGGSIYHCQGFKIPWLKGQIYHGQGFQNTIGRGFNIPKVVAGSKYHRQGICYTQYTLSSLCYNAMQN